MVDLDILPRDEESMNRDFWLLIAHIGGIAFCVFILIMMGMLFFLIIVEQWRKFQDYLWNRKFFKNMEKIRNEL